MAKARSIDTETDKRARDCIAQNALTNSKRPESFVKGVYPTHLVSGKDCRVMDSAGNTYIDFICGLGSNLLGYSHTLVKQAAEKVSGPTLSLSTIHEVELAERIKSLMPFIEKMKFLKSGSEGCSAAIRIARAHTKRMLVLSDHYHGWHDEFVSLTPPAKGIPPRSSIQKLDATNLTKEVAAVIIEPVVTDFSEERITWLRALREKCTEVGALLIWDETITALRFPKYCVANYYGIEPDIIVFGKSLANGYPISCVGGKAAWMDGDYFVSSSFAGEMSSIAAASATLKCLQTGYDLAHLWNMGGSFQKQFNEICAGVVKIEGYPTRGVLVGDTLLKALFMQETCKAGILFGASWFFCFPHIQVIDLVLNTLKDIVTKIKSGTVKLEGTIPQVPFAAKVRGG